MASFDLLDRAAGEFEKTLLLVTDAHRGQPTPCSDYTVRDLVGHVVGSMRIAVALLGGASREEGLAAAQGDVLGTSWVRAFDENYRAMVDAFRVPGALERTVAHPIGDIPATQLFDIRIGELTLHRWDLARAIGADETLDPELVAKVWGLFEPLAGVLPVTGAFGSGPSGDVPVTAPLQTRLLDLTGRRP